jgi:DNA-directed RNA polymerase subunit M/transcription elongation factor TFIIS
MQQITCPNCNELLHADNINIQQMTALCPACHHVFRVEAPNPSTKPKPRKVKQPQHLDVTASDDNLRMSFRTNFRLDRNQTFLASAIIGLTTTIAAVLTFQEALAGETSLIAPILIGLMPLMAFYVMALTVYNHTQIDVTTERITVSRGPLPNPADRTIEVPLFGVERVQFKETPASVREGYDTPRYTVWAQMTNGGRQVIADDLIHDYAAFVTQRINAYLHEHEIIAEEGEVETHNVLDLESAVDDEPLIEDLQGDIGRSTR